MIDTPSSVTFASAVNRGTVQVPAELQVSAGMSRGPFGACKHTCATDVVSLNDVKVVVSRDDRMPSGEAARTLDLVQARFGAVGSAQIRERFTAALWLCHTVNGSSTLMPGRSTFSVPDLVGQIDYGDVIKLLGVNARRFFRSYADDIADVNRRTLSAHDPGDPVAVENWSWIMGVAATRGLARYPYLAHDSADACLHLNLAERAALAASKVAVLSAVTSTADDDFTD